MKRILQITFLSLQFMLCVEIMRGQFALYSPDQVLTFNTQTSLDNYFASNPTLTTLTGIELRNGATDPIINTFALSNVVSIGTLVLDWAYPQPASYVDLSGLNNLTDVDTLWTHFIGDFEFATNITELDLLAIENSLELIVNFDGFDNLEMASEIYLNLNQPSEIVVDAFPSLHTVNQLMFDSSVLFGAADIGSFDGFNNVTSMQNLQIGNSYPITFSTLNICNAITQLDNFTISTYFPGGLPSINSISCQNVNSINNFSVFEGPFPFASVSAQSINGIYIDGQTSSIAFPNLTEVVDIELYPFVPIELDFPLLNSTQNVLIYVVAFMAGIQEVTLNFPQLNAIDGNFSMSNTSNSSLDFLENIVSIGGTIVIEDNPNLSFCNVDAVCNKLNISPNDVTIAGNTGDCSGTEDVIAACTDPVISGSIYYDMNCNQTFDSEDQEVYYPLIIDDTYAIVGTTTATGNFAITAPPDGILTFLPQTQPGTLPATPISVDTDTLTGDISFNFGLCPDPNFFDVAVNASLLTAVRPGFESGYEIGIINNSSHTETVQLTVDFSLFVNYSTWNISAPYNLIGNSIVFDPIILGSFEQTITSVIGTLSASIPLGTPASINATVSILNTDNDSTNNTVVVNTAVMGSYDPNDILVNTPLIDIEQADANGDWLTYRIRFQNTGNFPAEFINVVSEQDELVDMSTMQMIDASHANSWSFDGREVTWFFDNIQLPDSTTDLEGSQGYILYKVRTLQGLSVGDVLEVNAAIYFDFNEPVITNTATTEYYLCPEALALQTNDESICEYDIALLSASEGYEAYSWSYNDQVLSTLQTFNYTAIAPGLYTITCNAITTPQVCQSSASINMEVIAVPEIPIITQDGNTLSASGIGTFVWILDGVELNNTSNTLEITQTGEYSVYIDGDCPSDIASGVYSFNGINDKVGPQLLIYPNPAGQYITVANIPSNSRIELIDITGKICYSSMNQSSTRTIPLEQLSKGMYILRIHADTMVIQKRFTKE